MEAGGCGIELCSRDRGAGAGEADYYAAAEPDPPDARSGRASTAIRASEACGLQWRDIIWNKNQIKIERRWTAACIDKPKTKASKAPVALSEQLAWFLRQGRCMTPYARDEDWVFPFVQDEWGDPDVRRYFRN
jgi:integrase